jgi:hypothetical protein
MRHSLVRATSLRPAALLVAFVVAVGLGVAPACTADKSATSKGSTGAVAATTSNAGWLLVLDAKNAETARTGDSYHVTLSDYGDVLAFTDRPLRKARRTTVDRLVDGWDRLFGKDAPNAALSGITPDGKSIDVAVELTEPSRDNQSVAFAVRGVGVDRGLRLPERLVDVSLFIDDVDDPTEIVFASTFVPFDSSF